MRAVLTVPAHTQLDKCFAGGCARDLRASMCCNYRKRRMLVRPRSGLFLVDHDRVFSCPPGAHVYFALRVVRKRWWRWRGKGGPGALVMLCSCTVCGRGQESGYWKVGSHQRSPITTEDVGQPFIARRAHRYQGRDVVCVRTRCGASKGR